MFFNVFPFLIICCHIAKSVANLKDAEGISNANEPPSAPHMSTEPVDAGHQVTHGWCALQSVVSTVYHLAGELNYSKSIITELCNSLLDMFLSKRIFVAAAKWYVLKAWYAYLSDRRQRLRSFLEGAAQSLKRRSKMQRGHSPRL
jgi:hypothetical protein